MAALPNRMVSEAQKEGLPVATEAFLEAMSQIMYG
jgi:hypothetical protein